MGAFFLKSGGIILAPTTAHLQHKSALYTCGLYKCTLSTTHTMGIPGLVVTCRAPIP